MISLYARTDVTYHQVQVDVIHAQTLQRRLNSLLHPLMPRIVQLGGDPNLLPRHTRVFNAQPDFLLVAIREGGVDVAVAGLERNSYCVADLAGFGLPCS
jgi:hypothetical protein